MALALAISGCDKQPTSPTGPPPASLLVQGTAPTTGGTSQFAAIAVTDQGVEVIVTTQATWQSSNPAVVTVDGGLVRAIAPGNAVLTATFRGVSGSMNLVISTATCVFDVQPAQADIPGDGGSVTIAVNMQQGVNCSWTAQVMSSFLSVTGPASGTGSGSFTVGAGFNPMAARTATVEVAAKIVTISQARGHCVTSVTPATQSVPDQGGSFLLTVDAPSGCQWSIGHNSSFVTVDQRVRTGPADVLYQVDPNPSPNMRQATFTIDRFTIVVTQSGPTL